MEKKKAIKGLCRFFLVSAMVLSFFLCFCSEAVSAEKPRKGGILKILTKRSPRSIGWMASAGGPESFNLYPCIETLTSLDEEGKPIPFLAESWKFSPDLKTLTMKIRKGIKFHDGSDLNAEAVKMNIEDRRVGIWESYLKTIDSIEVIDPYTIRINLKEYLNTLLESFADVAGAMISPRVLEKGKTDEGKEWATVNPVGTGPFKFVKFERDVTLKYTRFDGYWEKGKPYLDGIEFHYIRDPMTAIAALRAGEADALMEVDVKQASELKKDGYVVIPSAYKVLPILGGDSKNPQSIYANKKVREAIEYGINRKAIADGLGYGFWEACNQNAFKESNGYNPGLVGRPYNPDKARELLKEAGYPNGFKTQFISGTESTDKEQMILLQQDMKAIGIDVEIPFYDEAKYFPLLVKGQKDCMVECSNSVSVNITQRHAGTFTDGSLRFKSLYRPPELQATLKEAERTPDYNKQKALTQKAVRLMCDEAVVIPLYVKPVLNVTSKKVHDVNLGGQKYQFTPAKAWLSK